MSIVKLTQFPVGKTVVKFKHLYISQNCAKEISKNIKGSGIKKDFEVWLLDRFREIDEDVLCYEKANCKHYEKIDGFYNITFRHPEKNIRILFSYEDKGNVNILLCATDEKKTGPDYKRLKRLAKQRLKEERDF